MSMSMSMSMSTDMATTTPSPDHVGAERQNSLPENSPEERNEHKSQSGNGKERVAVIGSGMAGLVVAHLLQRDRRGRFDVEVLEMQNKLSLDSASYTLPKSNSKSGPKAGPESKRGKGDASSSSSSSSSSTAEDLEKKTAPNDEDDDEEEDDSRRVDLPMRAFAAGYYDNLRRMYAYLGVGFGEPRFVYSVSRLPCSFSKDERKKGKDGDGAHFIHSSNNHILPPIRPAGVGVLRWVGEVVYLLFWYTWFTAACFWIRPRSFSNSKEKEQKKERETDIEISSSTGTGTAETLSSYITRIHLPRYYTTNYFLPLMSSITTCTHDQLLSFPASDIIGYARATYRQPHYTITKGVKQAEEKLSSGLKVRLGTRVTGVKTLESERVSVSWSSREGEGRKEYARVIIATTPDVVGSIFPPLSNKMRNIPTTSVSTVVHRDFSRIESISTSLNANTRLQDRRIRTFDPTSSFSPEFSTERTMPLTAMHMVTDSESARTESIHEHPANVLVTTYALENGIAEEKVLHRVRFTRVLRSVQSRDVVNGLFDDSDSDGSEKKEGEAGWRNGDGNVYLVGGWCWDGMVLLEGCIVSAMRVAEGLGVDVPWRE